MRYIVRISPDERMDLGDMQSLAGELELFDSMRRGRTFFMPAGENGGLATMEARIFDGFEATDAGAGVVSISRGSGFFKIQEEGVSYFGIMAGECGDATRSLDLSGEPASDYYIWIRMVYSDTTAENRVFWNAGGAPPAEYVDHPNTVRELVWEAVHGDIADAAPVGDWIKIAKVTILGAIVTLIEDYRHFYFEGDAGPGAGQWGGEWGTVLERNADRATYGVKSLWKWVQFVRTKIYEIQGPSYETWEVPDPDLTDLAVEHHTDGQHLDVNATSLTIDDRAGAPTTSNYIIASRLLAANHRLTFMADDSATDGEASIRIGNAGDHAQYVQNPRGEAAALVNADYGELVTLGPDNLGARHGLKTTITASGLTYTHDIGELSGTPPLQVIQGAPVVTTRGAYLTEASARFFHTSRQEWIWPQWSWKNESPSTNWVLGASNQMYCAAGHAAEKADSFTTDWPEGMTLDSIAVTVTLAAGAIVPFTVDAYRETYVPGGAVPTIVLIGTANTLAAGVTELTIAPAVAGWTHATHRLVLRFSAADVVTEAEDAMIQYTASLVSKYAQ